MSGDFIVSEEEPVRTYKRGVIRANCHAVQCAYGLCSANDITSMMVWAQHINPERPTQNGETYWRSHWMDASRYDNKYSLPEVARSYLRWLLKGKLVDTFKE